MALRLLNNQCIIHPHYRFISLLSSFSRFDVQHRYCSSNNNNKTQLISCFLSHDSHASNYKHHNGLLLYHYHNKHYFSSSKSSYNSEEEEMLDKKAALNAPTKVVEEKEKEKEKKDINVMIKIGRTSYNIIYYTLDSIISPSRGYIRLCNLWISIRSHAIHFWEASKLMFTDIKTASKILRKLRRGKELTYRERRQLRRVTVDALKFVPMLIIVLIPFLEALLPFILYVFPNMLPSRFQSEHMKIEKRKKLLAARIGLASFFEDTLLEYLREQKQSTKSLAILFSKLENNEEITNEEILRVASLFNDEITLDNASHSMLSNMCRYMDLNSFGTTHMLRHRLYVKIREIRREDQGIRKEGLDLIPISLLRQLLRERGMRSDFQEWVLRGNLAKWLELSLDEEVPVSLLVISRIFTLQHIAGQDATDRLKDAISTIGDATTKETLVERGAVDDLKTEKEIIERQQQLIEEEEKEELLLMAANAKDKMRDIAESAQILASENVVDPENKDIDEMREKLKEIKDFEITKKEDKISKRIDKMIEKSSHYAHETGNKFENTLKRSFINEEQLKTALSNTLNDKIFTDQQIDDFLKEFQAQRDKQPNISLTQLIEELADRYDQDIDIKDN